MTTTIDYAIRPYMREMYKQHRWGVLSILMLHANNLNRCWPSIVGIASDLGISPNQVTKAKNWLIERGAVQLVPYDKRIGQEELLGPRQLVYQLTGKVTIDGQTVSYLYGSFNITADGNVKPAAKNKKMQVNVTAYGNSKITDGDIIDGSNGSISTKGSPINTAGNEKTLLLENPPKQSQPNVKTHNNPIWDVVAQEIFGSQSGEQKKGHIATIVYGNPKLHVPGFIDCYFGAGVKPTPEMMINTAELLRSAIKWWRNVQHMNAPGSGEKLCKLARDYKDSPQYADACSLQQLLMQPTLMSVPNGN